MKYLDNWMLYVPIIYNVLDKPIWRDFTIFNYISNLVLIIHIYISGSDGRWEMRDEWWLGDAMTFACDICDVVM